MVEIQNEWIKRSQSTAGAGELHKQQSSPNHGYLSPNLDLDQSNHASIERFSDFANETLKRYELSNKKIDSFSLRIGDQRYCKHLLRDTATSLTVRALKLGATRLSVQMIRSKSYFYQDEVFGSKTLAALSLIRCSMLESLSLDKFRVQDSYVITRILSSCPLIRSLSLSHVSTADSRGYGSYSANQDDGYGYDYEYYDAWIRPHGLTSMVLNYVDFDTLLVSDLSTRFPCLKDLTLHTLTTEGDTVIISSPTVERLTFVLQQTSSRHFVVRFDIPSIRKFTYECSVIPRLSFISAPSRGWEVNVSITHVRKRIDTLWFVKLRKFLHKLRCSRMSSLALRVDYRRSVDYEVEAIQGSTPCEIENLTLDFEGLPSLSCYALLDGLFRLCRPKSITQRGSANNVDFLGRTLLEGTRVRISTRSQFMYALNNLKEARAEIFDEAHSVWRDDVALDSLLNDSTKTTPGDVNRNVRFQLNWHQSSTFRDKAAATNVDTRARVDEYTRNRKVGFEDGDFVWVVLTRKRYPRRTYFRFGSRRFGPFEIVEKVYSNAYRLRVPSHVGVPDVINVKHLLPYTGHDHYSSSDVEHEYRYEYEYEAADHVSDFQLYAWEFIEKREGSKHFFSHVPKRRLYRKPRRSDRRQRMPKQCPKTGRRSLECVFVTPALMERRSYFYL